MVLAVVALGVCQVVEGAGERPSDEAGVAEEQLSALEILRASREIIPREPCLLKGSITVRKRRGIVLQEHQFSLLLEWGANPPSAECLLLDKKGETLIERAVMTRPLEGSAQIALYSGPEQKPEEAPNYTARIRGSDITWLDLTMDYLWWQQARFDDVPRGESKNGRDCDVILVAPPHPIPGCVAVRIWVDRQLRCMMQAEQIGPQGSAVRKMWVQRVKKMDGRWMVREMEVESINSGHRTRLFVDEAAAP